MYGLPFKNKLPPELFSGFLILFQLSKFLENLKLSLKIEYAWHELAIIGKRRKKSN